MRPLLGAQCRPNFNLLLADDRSRGAAVVGLAPVGGVAHEVGQGQQERGPVQEPVERQQECDPARPRGGGCVDGDGLPQVAQSGP